MDKKTKHNPPNPTGGLGSKIVRSIWPRSKAPPSFSSQYRMWERPEKEARYAPLTHGTLLVLSGLRHCAYSYLLQICLTSLRRTPRISPKAE